MSATGLRVDASLVAQTQGVNRLTKSIYGMAMHGSLHAWHLRGHAVHTGQYSTLQRATRPLWQEAAAAGTICLRLVTCVQKHYFQREVWKVLEMFSYHITNYIIYNNKK